MATKTTAVGFHKPSVLESCNSNSLPGLIEKCFDQVARLGEGPRQGLCMLLRHHFVSEFGLNYLSKINAVLRSDIFNIDDKNVDDFAEWVGSDVMNSLRQLTEPEVLDTPKRLTELTDIVNTLNNSLNSIEDEDLKDEIDYILNIPYTLSTLIEDSKIIPKSYSHSYERYTSGYKETIKIKTSGKDATVSFSRQSI